MSILLVLVMVIGLMPTFAFAANTTEFADGSGTASDPYLIATKYHLDNVRNHLDAHFKMTADIEFTDADFATGGDFYNYHAGFRPIGDADVSFTGVFDGNRHVIKNLYIKGSSYCGLFAYNNGTIQSLGILIGNISSNEIGNAYAGGIVGVNNGVITECYNTCTVSSSLSTGGIAGINYGKIISCYNAGSISNETSNRQSNVGGIVGENGEYGNDGIIADCYNIGNILGNFFVGGIAGRNYRSTITGSYNTGTIYTKSLDTHVVAGGIAGQSYIATVAECYNTGAVSAEAAQSAYAGGITGSSGETVFHCFNTGTVSATSLNESIYVGGISGYNKDLISQCYNAGAIFGEGKESVNIGGIVGDNLGAIADCYNTAMVSVKTTNNSTYVGGIVGYNNDSIINCYNIGEVLDRTVAGGIAGYSNVITIINCYHLNTNSKGVGIGNDRTVKCTEKQMKMQSTFEGFDFETVWIINTKIQPFPIIKELHYHTYNTNCENKCNSCNFTRNPPHNYGKYVYNNDATEKKDGTKTRTCSVCGDKQTVTATGTKWTNPFGDVKKSAFYYTPVLWAVEKGITSGTSKTTFAPSESCTRGQIATFLWRAAGQPTPKTSKNPFTDVKKNDYYYQAVLWAVGEGITSGTSRTTFSPSDPCTRGQIATFLWRAGGSKKPATAKNPFKDVKNRDFYYTAVLWAVGEGITSGTSKTTFAPNQSCTRGQIATFLYRNYN